MVKDVSAIRLIYTKATVISYCAAINTSVQHTRLLHIFIFTHCGWDSAFKLPLFFY